MLLALVACWRPEPYVPPAPLPAVEAAEPSAEAPPAEDAPAPPDRDAEAGDEAPDPAAEGDPPAAPDEEQGPSFATYRARNVQAPVTLVDDYGKNLVVIPTTVELEVRDEDAIRARVWCASCTPAIEGWIQSHLLQRVD